MSKTIIDVSHWQGNINWKNVANDGVYGTYIKATQGSADGDAIKDGQMDKNFKQATANGLKAGFYHYATFVSVKDAKAEADWFIKHIKKHNSTLIPMLDLEENHCKNNKIMNKAAKAFMKRVENKIGACGLYSFGNFFANNVDKKLLKRFAYWHARYASDPVNVKLKNIYLWQYTDNGSKGGVSPVDTNKTGGKFFLMGGKKPSKKKKSKKKKTSSTKTYKIKSGDTLSGIASKFGTTTKKLKNLNNIKNPDAIQAGKTIKVTGKVKKKSSKKYHTVKSGDTVSQLAVDYNSTSAKIKKWNNLKNANAIQIGQKLRVK